MTEHKLANILINVGEHVSDYPGIYYHSSDGAASYDDADGCLVISGEVDFLTYFNALSAAKWRRYAHVDRVWLHLELSPDDCDVVMEGVPGGAGVETRETGSVSVDLAASRPETSARVGYDVSVPTDGMDLVGFAIRPKSSIRLYSAHYFTQVDEENVNPVRLALCTTTFRNEKYIIPNVEKVKTSIGAIDDPIAAGFHMFVVDNGQTLDAAGLSDDLVTVIPNRNVGGSGGFARGMMAALEAPEPYTHVLLMDDDVIISPESIKRTFNLLSLASGSYANAFVNGAMITLEKPNLQFEDVSFVKRSGAYQRVKSTLRLDVLDDIVENERTSVEVPRAYGAWWFCCIPTHVIREKGLPLPLFVRCDDVEYGMRTNPTFMTMNGICVWHQGFDGKFRASVDYYQYIRNFLIMIACDDITDEKLFVSRIGRDVRLRLRDLDYSGAELLVDAFRDYLKGPEFLAHADGAAILMANAKRNERMIPIAELDLDDGTLETIHKLKAKEDARRAKDPRMSHESSLALRALRTLPYDRHLLPNALLDPRPAVLGFYGHEKPNMDVARHSTIVALDADFENGAIRRLDKKHYERICTELDEATHVWEQDGPSIRASYKARAGYLTSPEFWHAYLGLDEKE